MPDSWVPPHDWTKPPKGKGLRRLYLFTHFHAELRAALKKKGRPTQKTDSLIASIALANHMVLVTRNTKHFEVIQEVSGLEIENWF